jgi:hypothetical protein
MSLAVESPPQRPPQTGTRRRRRWFRFRFPWIKTAVSAPSDDDELLVLNQTDLGWLLHLGYRDLGAISPHDARLYRVVKAGLLTARQVDAPVGTEYLTMSLGPAIQVVAIVELEPGTGVYLIQGREAKKAS